MRALCAPTSTDGKAQLIYYEIGVNGFYGGVFGKGLSENIRLAYEWLVENYDDGDEIFIFGFSRGAYTARSLAGLITKLGILKPGSPIGVKQLYERYKRSDEQTIWELHELQDAGTINDLTLEERWMLKYSQRVKIKVVAVWDTVGSLGIPAFSIEGLSRGMYGVRMIRTQCVPLRDLYRAPSNDGSSAYTPMLEADTQVTFLLNLRFAGSRRRHHFTG